MSSQLPVDAKTWSTLRARAATLGLMVFRSDERDGSVVYFSLLAAARPHVQIHPDMAGVRARITELKAGEEAPPPDAPGVRR